MGNEAHKSWSDNTDEFFDEAVARRRAEVDELFRDMIPSVLARLFETAEKLGGLTPEAFEKRRREHEKKQKRQAKLTRQHDRSEPDENERPEALDTIDDIFEDALANERPTDLP